MTRDKKENADALKRFFAQKTEIQAMLDRLQAHAEDHFGIEPEYVNWGHVGSLTHTAKLLEELSAFILPPSGPQRTA